MFMHQVIHMYVNVDIYAGLGFRVHITIYAG